jgi:uncharacterized damage-inducible protein DinB
MERVESPHTGDDRTLLVAHLDYLRATMAAKVGGVPDDKLAWSPVGSGTSLGGMLNHLTLVEDWWFSHIVGRAPIAHPWSEDDPDSDFRVPPGATAESMVAAYAAECARSNAVIAATDLDAMTDPDGERPGRSLRWVLVHMVEEVARHAGHADIVRELLDGTVGD